MFKARAMWGRCFDKHLPGVVPVRNYHLFTDVDEALITRDRKILLHAKNFIALTTLAKSRSGFDQMDVSPHAIADFLGDKRKVKVIEDLLHAIADRGYSHGVWYVLRAQGPRLPCHFDLVMAEMIAAEA
jgi:hypothetical protein